MASNPCKRRRTHLNGDNKQEICVYKDAHPKATCSDIAAHFAKEQWQEKKSGCLMSALVEQQNMASLEKHLCCGLMTFTHVEHQ